MRVSVIGTIHEAVGPANSDTLIAILRQYEPEVIFLEMPPEALEDHMSGNRDNLEADAVRRYRAERTVEVVAVDLPTPEPEFFAGWARVRSEVRSRSPEYCRLKSWEEQYVRQHGFDFLNSSLNSQFSADIHAVTLETLKALGASQLSAYYEDFTSTNDRRDIAMLSSIEAHCAASSWTAGVFLVGAAHRRSLFEKTREQAASASSPVLWDFPGTV